MSVAVGGLLLELAAEHVVSAVITRIGNAALRKLIREAPAAVAGEPGHPDSESAFSDDRPAGAEGAPTPRTRAGQTCATVEVRSHRPGRVRFAVGAAARDAFAARRLQLWLANMNGVARAEVNSLTGTVLVEYEPHTVTIADLTRALERGAAGRLSRSPVAPGVVRDSARRQAALVGPS